GGYGAIEFFDVLLSHCVSAWLGRRSLIQDPLAFDQFVFPRRYCALDGQFIAHLAVAGNLRLTPFAVARLGVHWVSLTVSVNCKVYPFVQWRTEVQAVFAARINTV